MLARHLHFEMPDLEIYQVDSKTGFDHGLGESSVECLDIYADWQTEGHHSRLSHDCVSN